ncbi:hypothetical protein KSP40_PGU011787 [Platanthera guangdongensis]|uniref:Uncharacterized protein n=1 Tax=Platanthera guangdongensis TaxID=2320717 RepID=A0ABR2N1Q1_9ASPA
MQRQTRGAPTIEIGRNILISIRRTCGAGTSRAEKLPLYQIFRMLHPRLNPGMGYPAGLPGGSDPDYPASPSGGGPGYQAGPVGGNWGYQARSPAGQGYQAGPLGGQWYQGGSPEKFFAQCACLRRRCIDDADEVNRQSSVVLSLAASMPLHTVSPLSEFQFDERPR